ncbi:hypothetical protein J6P92_05635 [bacterium]|nr:hypothetical protein [bacterium]
MALKIFCAVLLLIIEIPLSVKCWYAYKNVDIIRFVAIVLLMFLTAFFIYGIYYFIYSLKF